MGIPLKYNFLSLLNRRVSTLMTVLSVALVVFIFVSVMAMANGLETALTSSGDPLNVLVMRRGSGSELSSAVPRDALQTLKFLPGVATDGGGEPAASAEIYAIVNLPKGGGEGDVANVAVRGVSPSGAALRPGLRVVEGRAFQPGLREVIVSRSLAGRFPSLRLGGPVRLGRADWQIVGLFEAGNTTFDSEIWADVNQVAGDFGYEAFSSVLLRASDESARREIISRVEADPAGELGAVPESDYYGEQTWAAAPIKMMGLFIAALMGVGACFAAMNTMYAAVAYRAREVATLRVLGFKRRGILLSFLAECLAVSLAGGVLGCLLALPVNRLTTGTTNWQTFSEVSFAFRTSPQVLLAGLFFAFLIGLFGGFFPARRAARQPPAIALKKV
jgi:putative ABC transport system permease protein